jgi:hypothetical protein
VKGELHQSGSALGNKIRHGDRWSAATPTGQGISFVSQDGVFGETPALELLTLHAHEAIWRWRVHFSRDSGQPELPVVGAGAVQKLSFCTDCPVSRYSAVATSRLSWAMYLGLGRGRSWWGRQPPRVAP